MKRTAVLLHLCQLFHHEPFFVCERVAHEHQKDAAMEEGDVGGGHLLSGHDDAGLHTTHHALFEVCAAHLGASDAVVSRFE